MKNNRGGGVGLKELGGAYRFNSILLGKILQIISVICIGNSMICSDI